MTAEEKMEQLEEEVKKLNRENVEIKSRLGNVECFLKTMYGRVNSESLMVGAGQ